MEKAYVLWRAFQERLLAPVGSLVMLGATLLALLEVFRRYLLGHSFHWYQDAVTYFILSAIALYFGIAQRRGANLRVDVFLHATRSIGPRMARVAEVVDVLSIIFALVFMCGVVWWGAQEVLESQQYSPRTESLEFPLAPFMWTMEVGFACMVVSLFFQSWRGVQQLRGKTVLHEPHETEDHVD